MNTGIVILVDGERLTQIPKFFKSCIMSMKLEPSSYFAFNSLIYYIVSVLYGSRYTEKLTLCNAVFSLG